MKFRTDFVTNSSSSSFVAVRLTTRDGRASSCVLDDLELSLPLKSCLCRKDGELVYQDKPLRTSADLAGALLHLISGGKPDLHPCLLESLCAVAAFEQNTLEPQALLEVLARDPAFSSLAGTEPTQNAVEHALLEANVYLFDGYLGALRPLAALCANTVPALDELGAVTISCGVNDWEESEEDEDEDFDSDDTLPGDEFCSFDLETEQTERKPL